MPLSDTGQNVLGHESAEVTAPGRLTSGFVPMPNHPLVGGNNLPSSVSHSCAIVTTSGDDDSENGNLGLADLELRLETAGEGSALTIEGCE